MLGLWQYGTLRPPVLSPSSPFLCCHFMFALSSSPFVDGGQNLVGKLTHLPLLLSSALTSPLLSCDISKWCCSVTMISVLLAKSFILRLFYYLLFVCITEKKTVVFLDSFLVLSCTDFGCQFLKFSWNTVDFAWSFAYYMKWLFCCNLNNKSKKV